MIRNPARELAGRRRAASEQLRREVQRADGSLSERYHRAFRRSVDRTARATTLDRLFAACARARVAFVGDFHAVPAYQDFASRVLEETAARVPRVGLGVEFVFTRQQSSLDALQRGDLDDAAFRRRIHYREEWGYPWGGFGRLLETARRLGVPVFALDSSPRAGVRGLRRRDDHAARRIAAILEQHPGMRMVVLFGESHLAPAHLPSKVERRLREVGVAGRTVRVFQSPDEVYWRAAGRRDRLPEAVRLGGGGWAVFPTSPLAKYEAHRQVLQRWQDDVPPEDEVDLTPAVHHLIEVLVGWLGIRLKRRIRHRAGWVGDLGDAFPEVYSGPEASALLPEILRENGRSREEIREARALLRDRGALYESRSNVMFLRRYLPARAAGEGARFLRTALTGRLFVPTDETAPDPASNAYGAAYNEALAYLGSRLVDPASDYLSAEELRAVRPGRGRRTVAPALAERVRWIEAHARFEGSARPTPPEVLLRPLRSSRRRARTLARDLGHRLGRILYERVRAGEVPRATLRSWFTRPLAPVGAPARVVRLLRGE